MIKLSPAQTNALDKQLMDVMTEGNAVGLAVSVFDAGGDILYERFEGYRDKDKNLPLDENTVLGLASVTKSFTAVSIMQLAEKGLIDIHAPVKKYVPELAREDITIAHLLSHDAGFFPLPRMLVNDVAADMGITYEKDGELSRHRALAVEGAARLVKSMNEEAAMIGPPGYYYSYSNDGFALLSDIVMRVSGANTYAEYLEENVLKPLGMRRSGCSFEWPGDDNITRLYQMEDGEMTDHHDFYDLAFVLMGEGNMRSTIADMRRYVRMYMNRGVGDGGRLLTGMSVDAMTCPRIVSNLNEYYGYGLHIKPEGDITIIEHGGNLTGVASQIIWCNETGIGAVIISNTSNAPVSRMGTAVMRVCAGMPVKAEELPPVIDTWTANMLNRAKGEYASREGVNITLDVQDGRPVLTLNGEDVAAKVINAYMLKIHYMALDMTVRLRISDSGEIWAMDAGGRVITKKK